MELGRHYLKMSNMPKPIMRTLAVVSPEQLKREARPEDAVHLYAAMSARVCEIAMDENLSPEEFDETLYGAVAPYRKSLGVTRERVLQALVAVESEISSLNQMIGVGDDSSPAVSKLRARISGEPLMQASPSNHSKVEAYAKQKVLKVTEEKKKKVVAPDGESAIDKAVDGIDRNLTSGDYVNMQKIYQEVAEAIQRVLNLENCFIFVPEDFEPDKFSARFGVGPLYAKVKNRPLVQSSNGDIFSICLNRKEDILIGDVSAGKTRSVIPEWISEYSGINSFFVLPAKHENDLFALIFGSVSKGTPIALAPSDIKSLRDLRNRLAQVRQLAYEGKIVVV